jgi:hypothetical protein
MRAIQTRYAGCYFRSRLEARWAVFFDTLSIEWRYEPEGFDLGDMGWYLPDFYLPEHKTWIEIKPNDPSLEELLKPGALYYSQPYEEDMNEVFVFFGNIPYPWPQKPNAYDAAFPICGAEYAWKECVLCGDVHIGLINHVSCRKGCTEKIEDALLSGIYDLIGAPDKNLKRDVGQTLKLALRQTEFFGAGHKGEKLQIAYEAARSARFERKTHLRPIK